MEQQSATLLFHHKTITPRSTTEPVYRQSYQGEAVDGLSDDAGVPVSDEAAAAPRGRDAAAGLSCSWHVANNFGHRLCGRPSVNGEQCAEHIPRVAAGAAA